MSKKSSTFAPAIENKVPWYAFCNRPPQLNMVVLAQLVEHRIVVPSVVGSSPTLHP